MKQLVAQGDFAGVQIDMQGDRPDRLVARRWLFRDFKSRLGRARHGNVGRLGHPPLERDSSHGKRRQGRADQNQLLLNEGDYVDGRCYYYNGQP